jgi:hypothetical protein
MTALPPPEPKDNRNRITDVHPQFPIVHEAVRVKRVGLRILVLVLQHGPTNHQVRTNSVLGE